MKNALTIIAIFLVGWLLTHWLVGGQYEITHPTPTPSSYSNNNLETR